MAALLEIPSISKVFLSIFQAANLRDLVLTRGYFPQRGFNNSFGGAGKNNRHCMGILSRRVYEGCVCHVSATSIIASIFFRRSLLVTQPITLKGWECKTKHFAPVLLHCICCKIAWFWLPCHILGMLVTQ